MNNNNTTKTEVKEVKLTDQQIAAGMFAKLPSNVDQQFNLHQINAFTATVQRNERGKGIHSAVVLRNTSADNKNEFPKGQVRSPPPPPPPTSLRCVSFLTSFVRSSTSCLGHPWIP